MKPSIAILGGIQAKGPECQVVNKVGIYKACGLAWPVKSYQAAGPGARASLQWRALFVVVLN